jgi:phage gpG-like protein
MVDFRMGLRMIGTVVETLDPQGVDYLAQIYDDSNRLETVIARRLRAATHMKVDLEASLAWNQRRIIRRRMQYYTSPHGRVKS